jgi:disulfide oxidoreductase YuzD
MIEPINAVALAVAAGAAAAAKDVTAKAVKDAYDGLITLIKKVYRDHQHVQESVVHLTKKPEDKNRRAALEQDLKDAGVKVDQQLLDASQSVVRAVESHSPETARAIGMDIGEFKAAALRIKNLQAPKEGTAFRADKVDITGTATFDNIGSPPKT